MKKYIIAGLNFIILLPLLVTGITNLLFTMRRDPDWSEKELTQAMIQNLSLKIHIIIPCIIIGFCIIIYGTVKKLREM